MCAGPCRRGMSLFPFISVYYAAKTAVHCSFCLALCPLRCTLCLTASYHSDMSVTTAGQCPVLSDRSIRRSAINNGQQWESRMGLR